MLCVATVVRLSERLKSKRMQCLTQTALCWSHRVQKKAQTGNRNRGRIPYAKAVMSCVYERVMLNS